ncbi:MAG: heterodisulfide reductase-related iron-sulfur binding cluster [Myxococcales bacterium]
MDAATSAGAFAPTDALCYDPSDPRYFDRALLQKELTRAFSLCASCRMCFKFCDTFAGLFKLLDEREGNARQLGPEEGERLLTSCFQCKLCEVQCPYTPRDRHPFQLDFPKLVHRAMAIRARERGLTLQQRFLGDPDRSGRLARASLGLANRLNRFAPQRRVMEKTLGIDRRKKLPDFAPRSFEEEAREAGRSFVPGGEAVLFQTCFVQHNEPALGHDVLAVLDAAKVDVRLAAGLVCCGMPAWEHGDLGGLRERARKDLAILVPFVEKGAKVLVVNPTCSMMLRREWPHLLEGADRGRAQMVAANVLDPCEYLWSLREEPRATLEFRSTPGAVAYHAPCHLRAQGVGFKGRDLMRRIPGAEIKATVLECCGHNGTWAMKVEGFEASARIGRKAFEAMKEAGADVWATECPLAALQFEQHAGRRPLHPLTVLARALKTDGFPKRVERGVSPPA